MALTFTSFQRGLPESIAATANDIASVSTFERVPLPTGNVCKRVIDSVGRIGLQIVPARYTWTGHDCNANITFINKSPSSARLHMVFRPLRGTHLEIGDVRRTL